MATTAGIPAATGQAVSGNVHGGQQPISGSHIYLYAAGSTGYGSASTSLLSPTAPGVTVDGSGNGYVTSDANGNFVVPNSYTCPTGNPETYLYALGGNPGLADPATNNPAITLIAALGPCQSVGSIATAGINEVSTVGAISALAQFTADPTHIGTLPNNTTGLTNAFSSAANIVDIASALAPQKNIAGTGTVPFATINTLADIVSPCVNSASQTSAECAALFSAAKPPSGATPTTVAGALLDIALFPANNTAGLLTQINAAAPFQPVLTTAPASYTLGITYTGGGLNAPGDIVIDANGSAWIANCPHCQNALNATGADSIVGIGPQGAILSGTTGYTNTIHLPQGIAVDLTGNIWSANDSSSASVADQIMVMTPQGTAVSGFPFSDTNLNTPEQIAIDSTGNAWVSDFDVDNPASSNALKISAAGVRLTGPITSAGFNGGLGIGIDNNQTVYMAGTGSSSILSFDTSGNILSGSGAGYTGGGLSNPIGIAIDNGPHVWSVNQSDAVSEIAGNGTPVSPSTGYTDIGIAQADIISIDGAGTAWIANCRSSCPGSGDATDPDNILHLSTTGTIVPGASGYQDPGFSGVGATAIDASGNIWVTNNAGASVTELLGVAVPVDTPLALQVSRKTLGLPAGTIVTAPTLTPTTKK